jgi:hypothetical protein
MLELYIKVFWLSSHGSRKNSRLGIIIFVPFLPVINWILGII